MDSGRAVAWRMRSETGSRAPRRPRRPRRHAGADLVLARLLGARCRAGRPAQYTALLLLSPFGDCRSTADRRRRLAWLVVWSFLGGGILDRYARNRPTRGRGFFGACGAHFPAMLRLGVVEWLVWLAVGAPVCALAGDAAGIAGLAAGLVIPLRPRPPGRGGSAQRARRAAGRRPVHPAQPRRRPDLPDLRGGRRGSSAGCGRVCRRLSTG